MEKRILKKRTLTPEEKEFLEKKLMAGEYKSLFDMATDINDGKPTKEIENIIFKNMMKIMLNDFSA